MMCSISLAACCFLAAKMQNPLTSVDRPVIISFRSNFIAKFNQLNWNNQPQTKKNGLSYRTEVHWPLNQRHIIVPWENGQSEIGLLKKKNWPLVGRCISDVDIHLNGTLSSSSSRNLLQVVGLHRNFRIRKTRVFGRKKLVSRDGNQVIHLYCTGNSPVPWLSTFVQIYFLHFLFFFFFYLFAPDH